MDASASPESLSRVLGLGASSSLIMGQVPIHPEQFCASTSRTGEDYNTH
jgi:hypothetical protein